MRGHLIDSRFGKARVNLATNPRAGKNTNTSNGYFVREQGAGEGYTLTRVTGAADGPLAGVSTYYRTTISVAKGATTSATYYRNGSSNPAPGMGGHKGDHLVASLYARSSASLPVQLRVRTLYQGSKVGTERLAASVTLAPGVWQRLSVPSWVSDASTGPSGVDYDDVELYVLEPATSVIPVGGTLDLTAIQVEHADVLGTYFDGAMPPAVWNGTAHASFSTSPPTIQ